MTRIRRLHRGAAPVLQRQGSRARRGHRGEEGQALVLFVGALVTILTATGLVIDGGRAFVNRRQAQNAADLASLAGTRVIVQHYRDGGRTGAEVHAAVSAVAGENGCVAGGDVPCEWSARYIRPSGASEQDLGPVSASGSIPTGAQGVATRIVRRPPTLLLGLIGRERWDVDADAAAMTARSSGLPAGGVLPIAIDPPNNNFQPGSIYELTAGKDAPGNFSWLSWSGSNDAGSLAESICEPDNPALSFPAWIAGDPGRSNSSRVRDCVDLWIDRGDTVLLPTWTSVSGTGNGVRYEINGLAAVVLLDRGNPAIDTITGRFVEYYALPTIPANWGGPPCAPGPGCGDQSAFMGVTR